MMFTRDDDALASTGVGANNIARALRHETARRQ